LSAAEQLGEAFAEAALEVLADEAPARPALVLEGPLHQQAESIVAYVREQGSITMGWLREHTTRDVASAVIYAKKRGHLALTGRFDSAVVSLPHLAPVELDARRSLPVLAFGTGERHEDCDHYAGCLDRFVRQPRPTRRELLRQGVDVPSSRGLGDEGGGNDHPGHCPDACPHFRREGAALERLHMAASRPGDR
jgi:hypothetical protein